MQYEYSQICAFRLSCTRGLENSSNFPEGLIGLLNLPGLEPIVTSSAWKYSKSMLLMLTNLKTSLLFRPLFLLLVSIIKFHQIPVSLYKPTN